MKMSNPYVKIIADYTAVTLIFQGIILIILGFTACLAEVIVVGIGIIFEGVFDIIKGYILLKGIVQEQARIVRIFLILFVVSIFLHVIGTIVSIVIFFWAFEVAAKAIFLLFMALLFGYEAFLYFHCQQHYQNLLMDSVTTSAHCL